MLLKMTTTDSAEETLLKGSNFEEDEDEEEEEALSLSDLPLNLINGDDNHQNQPGKAASQVLENEEEFNFGSWGGSLSTESEMCAADDVFFKGQILPLRLSVSSDSALSRFQNNSSHKPGRCLFRSESMDRGRSSLGGLTSVNSSRSSSTASHYSSSSNSSTTNTTTNTTNITTRNSKPRMRNHFNTYPSPKPQIRVCSSRLGRNGSGNRSQIRTKWDLFRLGLVRAPEIELQDLKLRNNNHIANRSSVSRNSSSGSSSNSSSSVKNKQELEVGKQRSKKQSFLDKKFGLFDSCKCSITAVETVPLSNIVIIKSEADESSGSSKNNINESSAVHAMEKKLRELKIKKKMINEKKQGKQAMSRHRTFEWLKELSHASYAEGNFVVD